jgi:predicted dehydrogenase
VVIATLDDHRIAPLAGAMAHGLHILVEKPLCTNPLDLVRVHELTRDYDKICVVCHQLRFTPVYRAIKELIDSGSLGRIVAIQHDENVSYHHMAHSLIRGYLHDQRGPILLAKCCHDMDLLTYLTGKAPLRVSSFGALNHFRSQNAPAGAPAYCLDGCPAADTCPYDVMKTYFSDDTDPAYLRQMGFVQTRSQLLEVLKTNRFGRCVFHVPERSVDSQSAIILFEDDINVSFMMCGHNGTERRRTKISMTNAEIIWDGDPTRFNVHQFEPGQTTQINVRTTGTHGGGDRAIMDSFVHGISSGDHSGLLTPITKSFDGHMLVFAAEASRLSGQTVDVPAYAADIRRQVEQADLPLISAGGD